MRRFDKKKNIEKLNERVNKKPSSLTESFGKWGEMESDAFPEEFKGLYDDEFSLEDEMGPSPEDLGSPIENQHRQELRQGTSGLELEGEFDDRFTPNRDEPIDIEKRYNDEHRTIYDAPIEEDGMFGGEFGAEGPLTPEHQEFLSDCPAYMNDRQKFELLRRRFPEARINYEDVVGHNTHKGFNPTFESTGKNMNVLSEASQRTFEKLCGLKINREAK